MRFIIFKIKLIVVALLMVAHSVWAIDFEDEIFPIFRDHCLKCHCDQMKNGDLKRAKADFYMDSRVGLLKGGVSGAVIVPHSAEDSYLVELISLVAGHEDLMPPKNGPLKDSQLKRIRDWIDGGADFGGWEGKQGHESNHELKSTKLSSFQKTFQNYSSNCSPMNPSELKDMGDEPFLIEAMTSENRLFSLSFKGYGQNALDTLKLWESHPKHIFRLDLSGHDLTQVKWLGFEQLYELNLSHSKLSVHLAEKISQMTSLRKLNLYACSWPMSHVHVLLSMVNLKVLVLSDSNLSLKQCHGIRAALNGSRVVF